MMVALPDNLHLKKRVGNSFTTEEGCRVVLRPSTIIYRDGLSVFSGKAVVYMPEGGTLEVTCRGNYSDSHHRGLLTILSGP